MLFKPDVASRWEDRQKIDFRSRSYQCLPLGHSGNQARFFVALLAPEFVATDMGKTCLDHVTALKRNTHEYGNKQKVPTRSAGRSGRKMMQNRRRVGQEESKLASRTRVCNERDPHNMHKRKRLGAVACREGSSLSQKLVMTSDDESLSFTNRATPLASTALSLPLLFFLPNSRFTSFSNQFESDPRKENLVKPKFKAMITLSLEC